jgi:hypothetical protein
MGVFQQPATYIYATFISMARGRSEMFLPAVSFTLYSIALFWGFGDG